MRKDNGEPHWPLTGMITRECGGEELAPHHPGGHLRGRVLHLPFKQVLGTWT